MCHKITMLKYQVGFNSFPIVYTCPNCLSEIRGKVTNASDNLIDLYSFENGKLVNRPTSPDYFLKISRELPTEPIKNYEPSDELAISPYLLLSHKISSLNDQSLWKRANHFVNTNTLININKVNDLYSLLENDKLNILTNELRNYLPVKYFPLNNTLEIYRGFHAWFVDFMSDLLPYNWTEDTQIFKKIRLLDTKHYQDTLKFIKYFENNGTFKNLEHRLFGSINYFLRLVDGILPVFLMFDCPSLRNNSQKYIISTTSFERMLDFYHKSYETIMDSSIILIALNNIIYRNDYDILTGTTSKTFSQCCSDSNKKLRLKNYLIDTECFSEFIVSQLNNRIRNSIGHFSTKFDGVKQFIQFIDTNKGNERISEITLTDFAILCIENFHTCFYLLEVIYQLRKRFFLAEGDIPFYTKSYNAQSGKEIKVDKCGRNELCPCGSGKKYKNCCWKKDQFL